MVPLDITARSIRRYISFGLLAAFISSHCSPLPASAAVPGEGPEALDSKALDGLKLPSSIGSIEEFYKGKGKETVVLIQDAHAIPEAQKNIREIIRFFQNRYGVDLVGLEGASAELDFRIFRSFPGKKRLEEVFGAYLESAELTGAAAAAILNDEPAHYQGIEDWGLYEEGLRHYLKTIERGGAIDARFDSLRTRLEAEKEANYSSLLLEVDRALSDFRAHKTGLAAILKKLSEIKAPAEGSELELILREMENSERGKSDLVKTLEELVRRLPLESLDGRASLELNRKVQELRTSGISPEAFALFLEEFVFRNHLSFEFPGNLAGIIEVQKRIHGIEGSKLFKDFDAYAAEVKETLFQNDTERVLDRRSSELDLLGRLSRLELTFEDWADVSGMNGAAEGGVPELLEAMETHRAFYKNAVERDTAMFQSLMRLMKEKKTVSALVVAGGFHTQGLTSLLREKDISYAVVRPGIGSMPEHTRYRELLLGKVSWHGYLEVNSGKVDLFQAMTRAGRDELLKGSENGRSHLLKEWRDRIIAGLTAERKLEKAHGYLAFLDEIEARDTESFRAEWRSNIERFLGELEKLNARNQLTEANLAKILTSATLLQVAGGNRPFQPGSPVNADLFPALQSGLQEASSVEAAPLSELRSETGFMDELENALTLSPEQLRQTTEGFLQHMQAGLDGDPLSLKMINSFVPKPTGKESGTFLALDLGGTNFRVLRVTLENGAVKDSKVYAYKLTDELIKSEQSVFFGFIADKIAEAARTEGLSEDTVYPLGFSFAFPVNQTSINSGTLIHWDKGFEVAGAEGEDVVRLLNDALTSRSITNVKTVALVNDTVGTLATVPEASIGAILGTGTNGAYWSDVFAVNTEWGAFNAFPEGVISPYDRALDASSDRPGSQVLEKMVSGKYLGEAARLVLADLQSKGILRAHDKIAAPYKLETADISAAAADTSAGLEIIGGIFPGTELSERQIIKRVSELIITRSARIFTAISAALIEGIDPGLSRNHKIAVDGSVYEKSPFYQAKVLEAALDVWGENASQIEFVMTKDGSGLGAAIIAALASQSQAEDLPQTERSELRISGPEHVVLSHRTMLESKGFFRKFPAELYSDLILIEAVYTLASVITQKNITEINAAREKAVGLTAFTRGDRDRFDYEAALGAYTVAILLSGGDVAKVQAAFDRIPDFSEADWARQPADRLILPAFYTLALILAEGDTDKVSAARFALNEEIMRPWKDQAMVLRSAAAYTVSMLLTPDPRNIVRARRRIEKEGNFFGRYEADQSSKNLAEAIYIISILHIENLRAERMEKAVRSELRLTELSQSQDGGDRAAAKTAIALAPGISGRAVSRLIDGQVLILLKDMYRRNQEELRTRLLAQIDISERAAVDLVMNSLDEEIDVLDKAFSIGASLPAGVDEALTETFLDGFLDGLNKGETSELLYDESGTRLPAAFQKRLAQLGIRRHAVGLRRSNELAESGQDKVPFAFLSEASEVHSMFLPLVIDQIEKLRDDPMTLRFLGKLTSRALIHLAELANDPELKTKPDLLEAELLRRLNLEGYDGLISIIYNGPEIGFGINAILAKQAFADLVRRTIESAA